MHISALAFIFLLLKCSRNVKQRCNLIKLSRVIDTNFVLIEAYTIHVQVVKVVMLFLRSAEMQIFSGIMTDYIDQ